jgi:hypothetical protein
MRIICSTFLNIYNIFLIVCLGFKNNLGYYDDFNTNIGIDVKIKKDAPSLTGNDETLIAERDYRGTKLK